jgi:type II secretory pathway pseudopilin PulG
VFGVVVAFALVAALAYAIVVPAPDSPGQAAVLGLLVGAGVVAASFGINYQFANRSTRLWHDRRRLPHAAVPDLRAGHRAVALMPSPETLERFIATVEANLHVEAIERFYAERASMQENDARRARRARHAGRNERAVMAKARAVRSRCVRPVFVAGDRVVIRWQFHFDWPDGSTTDIEELACQRWEGEKVVEERFYYDPAQLQRKPPC